MAESEITPEFVADPENREGLRARARNTANVNPEPTTLVPIKSDAVSGPAASRDAKALADAGAAVVDPSPELNATASEPGDAVSPGDAETATSDAAKTARTAKK
jgi:hypothetical protein